MRLARARSASALLLVMLAAGAAHAGVDEHVNSAQSEIASVARESGGVQALVEKTRGERTTVEQRLANGELLYRTKDYDRAEVVLSEVIETYPDTANYVDALWLRAEVFYASKQFLSARRDYRELVAHGSERRFQSYIGKALARLVDVSVRLDDVALLDDVFKNLGLVPPSLVDAALTYAEGKALYLRRDYALANTKFAAVATGGVYTPQARYYQGLVAMKLARPTSAAPPAPGPAVGSPAPAIPATDYKFAVEAFRQVTVLPADTDEHKHVIDLAWMAIGRLAYEMEQYDLAKDSYSKVNRDSPEFDTMLYELAWVYVRMGDVQHAERTLEVLSVANPDSEFIADGTLLRADLLLRTGAFDKALQLYQSIRDQYDPLKLKVETFLDSNKDPAVYYDKLSRQELDALDQTQALPAIALRWAREAEDGPLAFTIIDDLGRCKKFIKESEILIEKLNALSQASNRVRAFPDLLVGEQLALGLINRLSLARVEIAKGLDGEEPAELGGDIGGWRKERRSLMASVGAMPTNSAEFSERDEVGTKQWNGLSQKLTRSNLEVDQLQAVVNGLRRMLREDAQRGVARAPQDLARFNDEIDANERTLRDFREQVSVLRRQIDVGRAQIGLGDKRYQDDAQYRGSFRDALEHEVQGAAAGQAGRDAQSYAQRVQGLLRQARDQEDTLTAAFMALERQVQGKTVELQSKIDAEVANIARFKITLSAYDGEARELVGRVAQRNITIVRDKLRGIVLRADVGVTEQAWEVREEELARVRNLQTERSREEQLLDEELKEVLDDSGDPGAGRSGGNQLNSGAVAPAK